MGKSLDLASADDVFNRFAFGIVCFAFAFWWAAKLPPRASPIGPLALMAGGFFLVLTCRRLVSDPMLAVRYKIAPARVVGELIEKWAPERSDVESDHEKSLHAFLKHQLPFVKAARCSSHSRPASPPRKNFSG